MLYVAIDQHSKQLTVNVRGEDGEVIVQRQVSTQWKSVKVFLEELQRSSEKEGGYVVIVEVCGFNDWLLELLPQYGCREIVLIQPDKRSRTKTDRRDSNQLGEILWVNRGRLLTGRPVQGVRRVHIPSASERDDRRLTMLRCLVGRERTRVINGIKHLLHRHNLMQECPTKGIQTQAARKWLRKLPLGDLDRLELKHLLARWKLADRQLVHLEQRIKVRQAEHPTASIVASLPGCGAYSSLGLASRVGPIERFPRPRSLARYWGLTPGCRNSGEATKRLGSITKEGSAMARFLLGQLVVHVLRKDAWMRAWYKQIKRRRGSKIARVAVMRRLATIIWHMLRHKEPYVPGGPVQLRFFRRMI